MLEISRSMKLIAEHIPASKIVACFSVYNNFQLKALMLHHLKKKKKLHCFKLMLCTMTDGKKERKEEGWNKEVKSLGH